MINFSLPLKFCSSEAEYEVITTGYYPVAGEKITDNFFVFSAGVMGWLNIIRPVSLGGGVNYRVASGAGRFGTNADFSGYSVFALIRLKWGDFNGLPELNNPHKDR
jgi:hypothetical protein